MRSESNRASVEALKNLIAETDLILSTTEPLPENRTERCRELLSTASKLANDLLSQNSTKPAAIPGHKGGNATSRRHGPEHYLMMAAARQTHAGGRPRKQAK